ncbi:hypothetical protein [Streptomyces griseiscabiei]|uniref:Uncharacterized protein n=1 Tax=Streptomyces griseiscabiei TaxID=2993540 RepID=A0ABU4LC84_9ACTN|nr:hypothetical protein [Streptomyces griseiscabiei]MBZ3907293.1 hypothetical protein [Streptomyces griseiscabiei]MDX2913385.1 hypothetical protein [Streptomyces griseiscabiei]
MSTVGFRPDPAPSAPGSSASPPPLTASIITTGVITAAPQGRQPWS